MKIFFGCHVAQRAVRSRFVVLAHPPVRGFSNIIERGEPIPVEQFLTVRAIESLNVSVLIRLPGWDVLESYTVVLGPSGERLGEKLRPVVGTDDLGQRSAAR